ncbi:hypothetical protein [Mastigocoleus testarum]|uniref:Uncharacterized protein n=1 Tax=Mastigocoleus testarum BC008 TaxID=371196 RepID=A0A0V7ZL29_9CYAN|nr:hypothetical protein [Mastigocoleus testarum]KST65245.1 hypothetical protein BC008_20860 [Mastigocoleus testarum BC008]
MATLQIKQLINSTVQITSKQQQEVHGGGASELLEGYANGSYRLEQSGSLFNFVDAPGNKVGTLINKGGYNFFIHKGSIEAVKGGSIDSVLNVGAISRF